jgi:hypothetical protein
MWVFGFPLTLSTVLILTVSPPPENRQFGRTLAIVRLFLDFHSLSLD